MSSTELRDHEIERLIATSARRGFAIAFDLVRDRAEAEDLVQEAVARALGGYWRLRDPAALEAWFFRVLANLCRRALRRRRVRAMFEQLWRGQPPPPASAGPATDRDRLLAAVGELPVMQHAVMVLRYGHDLGVDEIAAMLGVGAETVKTHLKRGHQRLRARFGGSDER